MIRSPISTFFFFSVWPLENLRWCKWLKFFWHFSTGQHFSRQQEWFVQRPRGSAVCAEVQGVWRTGRDFSLLILGVGRELVRVGEVAGSSNTKGPVSPFKASLEESSLVVQWLRLCASTAGITGSIPLLGELRSSMLHGIPPPPQKHH